MSGFKPDMLIDLEWMHKLSFNLENFSRVSLSSHVYSCRCPVCGDSKRSQRKRRFFFYTKRGQLNVDCKNCNYGRSFYNFVKEQFPNSFEEYRRDQFRAKLRRFGDNVPSNTKKENKLSVDDVVQNKPHFKKHNEIPHAVPITKLDKNHVARKYLDSRAVPLNYIEELYYSECYYETAKELSPKPLNPKFPKDARIVIPFWDEEGKGLESIQGRSLSKDGIRYITIKVDTESDKIFNKHNITHDQLVYVVEGVFDAMFLPNCVAVCDSSLWKYQHGDVYVPDNEPRNKQIVQTYERVINMDKGVVIWPSNIPQEMDINDLYIHFNKDKEKLLDLINSNVYFGLKAKLELSRWRKV